MKNYIMAFIKRGAVFSSGGPVILAIIYLTAGNIHTVSPKEAATAILSVTLLAYIAAGITIVYGIEKLPLFSAMLIHGTVLYFDYLIMYFINNWIPRNLTGLGIFSAVFIICYTAIWLIIYLSIKIKTKKLNKKLNSNDNSKSGNIP